MEECLKSFNAAQNEIFQWLEDEYHLIFENKNSIHVLQHELKRRDALDGDEEYRKFVLNERRGHHKSSRNDQQSREKASKVSEQLDGDTSALRMVKIQSKVEKLHGNEELSENNDKTMSWQVQQLLQDVSDHYRAHHNTDKADSNYIEGRLNTKISLASEQNALNEIGEKYRHLLDDGNKQTKNDDDENLLNENQLHDEIESSNSNFQPEKWSTYEHSRRPLIDSSSWQKFSFTNAKRSSGHLQNLQKKLKQTDDQLSTKKNDLWDEENEKLSKNEQQGLRDPLVPLHRVKRGKNHLKKNSPDDGDDEYGTDYLDDGKKNLI